MCVSGEVYEFSCPGGTNYNDVSIIVDFSDVIQEDGVNMSLLKGILIE